MLRTNGGLRFGEFFDLKFLVRTSSREEVYLCPYCEDTKGKFYYNPIKQVGHCFKCETVIVSDALRSPELIRQQLNSVSDEDKYQLQKLSLKDWAYPIRENQDCLNYMVYSRGITPGILDRFNVLATRTPTLGVVFCNRVWDHTTDFLTIRNVNSYMRHTNLSNQVKPLMWCNHVDTNCVALVEGTTSGLSVYQHLEGTVSPLVLLGKTISELQLSQLKAVIAAKKIERIYVVTDGGFFEYGIKIAKITYKALDRQDVFVIKMPWKSDPNSVTQKKFREIWDKEAYHYQPLGVNLLRFYAYGGSRK